VLLGVWFAAIPACTLANTAVKSNITTNTTWTTSGSPYDIDANIKVSPSATLTIDPPPVDPCTIGHVVVEKQLLARNGQPILSELGGISFEVKREGATVGGQFSTDSSGRAISPPLPRGVALVVHEISPPTGFQQAEDVSVTLTAARELITIVNHQSPEGPPPIYTG
jgi:hypothetical protein